MRPPADNGGSQPLFWHAHSDCPSSDAIAVPALDPGLANQYQEWSATGGPCPCMNAHRVQQAEVEDQLFHNSDSQVHV